MLTWQLSNLSRKGKRQAQWSEGKERYVSLPALGCESRDACGSICGHICYKWKKYHNEVGKALRITQPHAATKKIALKKKRRKETYLQKKDIIKGKALFPCSLRIDTPPSQHVCEGN